MEIILNATLACPNCGHLEKKSMPTRAFQFFYECQNCETLLKPKEADCCVYCSYSDQKCPPVQRKNESAP